MIDLIMPATSADAGAVDTSCLTDTEVPRGEVNNWMVALERADVLDSHQADRLCGGHLFWRAR